MKGWKTLTMKYQCYYNEKIWFGDRAYTGKRYNKEIFETEEEAEKYCIGHVGIMKTEDGYLECEMLYEEIKKECIDCKYRTENASGYPYCDYFDDWIRDCQNCPKW